MRKVVLLSICCITPVLGEGLLAFKSHNQQDDKDAKILVYTKLTSDAEITWVETAEGKKFSFDLFHFKEWIEIPTIPSTIVSEAEKNNVKAIRDRLELFSKRFPASGKPLTQVLESLTLIQRRINAGQVKFEGEWMDLGEQQQIIRRRAELDAQVREVQEAKRMAEEEKIGARREADKAAAEALLAAAKSKKEDEDKAQHLIEDLKLKQNLEGLDREIESANHRVSTLQQQKTQKIQKLNEFKDP